jgi:hypothetical protein
VKARARSLAGFGGAVPCSKSKNCDIKGSDPFISQFLAAWILALLAVNLRIYVITHDILFGKENIEKLLH